MIKSNVIGIGLISLIPIGFIFKYLFNPDGIVLFIAMAALIICVVNFSILSFLGKNGQSLVLYMNPIIMIPAIYLISVGVSPTQGNKFDSFTIISVVTAYSTLCIVLGVKIGSYKEKNITKT